MLVDDSDLCPARKVSKKGQGYVGNEGELEDDDMSEDELFSSDM